MPSHSLIDGTLTRGPDGIDARCTCGWRSLGHFSSLAASAAFREHQEEATKPQPAALDSLAAMQDDWASEFADFGRMLESIGGWTIGCENHVANKANVDRAIAEGLVGERIHKAPIDVKGWPCFELTDAGIDKVRELRGAVSARRAMDTRQWYRDNAAKYAKCLTC